MRGKGVISFHFEMEKGKYGKCGMRGKRER